MFLTEINTLIILLILLIIVYYYTSPICTNINPDINPAINPNPNISTIQPFKNIEHFQQDNVNNFEDKDDAFDNQDTFNLSTDNDNTEPFNDENLEPKSLVTLDKKYMVIVFLSKGCPHCITYDKRKYNRLVTRLNKLTGNKIIVRKIYSDKDPKGLFDKYKIQYVPAAIVISEGKSGKKSQVQGEISPKNIIATIKSMN